MTIYKGQHRNSVTEILNYLEPSLPERYPREAAKFGYRYFPLQYPDQGKYRTDILQIIRDIKLNQAAMPYVKLLSAICDSELVGYESPEHFTRTLKTYGMTSVVTGRRTGNKRLQDLFIYFFRITDAVPRYLSYPPL